MPEPERILNFRLRDEFNVPDIREAVNIFFTHYGNELRKHRYQLLFASLDVENNSATFFINDYLYKFTWLEIK